MVDIAREIVRQNSTNAFGRRPKKQNFPVRKAKFSSEKILTKKQLICKIKLGRKFDNIVARTKVLQNILKQKKY